VIIGGVLKSVGQSQKYTLRYNETLRQSGQHKWLIRCNCFIPPLGTTSLFSIVR
jgi:hypothetical protein